MLLKKASLVAASLLLSAPLVTRAASLDWNGRQVGYTVAYENGVAVVKDAQGNVVNAAFATTGPAQGGSGVWDAATANWIVGGASSGYRAAIGASAGDDDIHFGGTGGIVLLKPGVDTNGKLHFNAGGYEIVPEAGAILSYASLSGASGHNKLHNAFGGGVSIAENATIEIVTDISGSIGALTGKGDFVKSGGGILQYNAHQGDGVYKNASRPVQPTLFIDLFGPDYFAEVASGSPGGRPEFLEGNPNTANGGVVGNQGALTGTVTINAGVMKVGGYLNQWKEYPGALRESKFDVPHMQGASRIVLNGSAELAFINSPLNVADDVGASFGGAGGALTRKYNYVQNLSAGLNHDQINTRLNAGSDASYRLVVHVDAPLDTFRYLAGTVDPQFNTVSNAVAIGANSILPAGTVLPRNTVLPAGFDMNNVDQTFTTGVRIRNATRIGANFTLPAGTYFERGTALGFFGLGNFVDANGARVVLPNVHALAIDTDGTVFQSDAIRQAQVGSVGVISGRGDLIKTGKGELRIIGDAERDTGRLMVAGGRVVLSSASGNAIANMTSVNLAGLDATRGKATRPELSDQNDPGLPVSWREGVLAAPTPADLVLGSSQQIRNFQSDFAFSAAAVDTGLTVTSAIQQAAEVDNRAEGLIAGTGRGSRIFLGGNTLTIRQDRDGLYRGSIYDRYTVGVDNSITPDRVTPPTGGFVKTGAATLALLLEDSYFNGVEVAQGRLLANVQALGFGQAILSGGELQIIQLNAGTLNASLVGSGTIRIGAKAEITNGSATPLQINSGGEVGLIQVGRVQKQFTGSIDLRDGVSLHFTSAANDALLNVSAISLTGGELNRGSMLSLGDSVQHLRNVTGDANARIELGRGTLYLSQGDSGAFAGHITGVGNLVKDGGATLTVDGTKTAYYGATVVKSGTLVVSGADAIWRSSGLVLAKDAQFSAGGANQSVSSLFGEAGSVVAMGGADLTVGLRPSREALLLAELAGGTPLSSNYLSTQDSALIGGTPFGPLNFDTRLIGAAPVSDPENKFRLSNTLTSPLLLTADTTYATGIGLPAGALPSDLNLSNSLTLTAPISLGGDTALGATNTTLVNGATLSGTATPTAITLNRGANVRGTAFGSAVTLNQGIQFSSSAFGADFTANAQVTISANPLPAAFVTPGIIEGQPFFGLNNVSRVAITLPIGTTPNAVIQDQNGNIIAQAGVPLAAPLLVPIGSFTFGTYTIPAGATIAAGEGFPGGATLQAGVVLAAGTQLPSGSSLPAGTVIPAGAQLPDNSFLPADTQLPAGTRLPAGSQLPSGSVIAAGGALPAGTQIQSGTTLSAGVVLPANTVLGAAVQLANGSVLQANTTLPVGTTLSGSLAAATRRFLLNIAGFSQASAEALAFAGNITGSGRLIKVGSDDLILTGVNQYTGATEVQGGRLIVDFDAIPNTSGVTVAQGATLGINADAGQDGVFTVAVSGAGDLDKFGLGKVTLSKSVSLTGNINGRAGTLVLTLPSTGAVSRTITFGDNQLDPLIASSSQLEASRNARIEFVQNNNATITGALKSGHPGDGVFAKSGVGTLTIDDSTNVSGFTGRIEVSGGTLVMPGMTPNDIAVARGATFQGKLTTDLVYLNSLTGVAGVAGGDAGKVAISGTGVTLSFGSSQAGFANGLLEVSGLTVNLTAGTDVFPRTSVQLVGGALRIGTASAQSLLGLGGDGASTLDLGANSLRLNTEQTADFKGLILGSGTLIKAGAGKQSLSGQAVSAFSGTVQVDAGELEVTPTALGTAVVNVNAPGGVKATLALRNDDISTPLAFANTFVGQGILAKTGRGAVSVGTIAVTGGVEVRDGRLITGDAAGDAVFNSVKVSSGASFLVRMSADRLHDSGSVNAIADALPNSHGALAVSGAHTLTMAGAQSYHGDTELLNSANLAFADADARRLNGLVGDASSTVTMSGDLIVRQGTHSDYPGALQSFAGTFIGATSALTIAGPESGAAAKFIYTGYAGNLGDTANTGLGTVTVTAGGKLQVSTANTKAIALAGGALYLDSTSGSTYTGEITGAGDLIKTGTGTLVFASAPSIVGKIGVDSGSLQLAVASLNPAFTTGLVTEGSGTLVLDTTGSSAASPVSLTTSVSGNGAVQIAGGGKLQVNDAVSRVWQHTGSTTLASGTTLGGNFATSGALTIATGATLAPGNSPGTVAVNGAFTLSSGATLDVELNASTSDKVVVSGPAALAGVIATKLDNTPGASAPVRGRAYTIVTATGGITVTNPQLLRSEAGNAALPVDATLTMLGFNRTRLVFADANTLNLYAVQNLASTPGYQLHSGLSEFAALADAGVLPADIQLSIDTASAGALTGVVNNLTPLGYAAEYAMAQDGVNRRQALLHDRLEQRRYDRASSLTTEDAPWEAFVVVGSTFVDNSDGAAKPTFDYNSHGGLVGLDKKLDDEVVVGGAIAYDNGKATLENSGGKVDLNRVSAVGFLSTKLTNRWYLDGGVSAGYGLYESKRNTPVGTVTGDNDGFDLGAYVETGTVFALTKRFHLTPYAALGYTHHEFGGFTETGASSRLKVEGWSQDSLRAKVGTGFGWFTGPVKLGLDVALAQELLDTESDLDARFVSGGSRFGTTAAALPGTTVSLTPSVTWSLDSSSAVSLGYTYEMGDDSRSYQSLNFSFRTRF